MRHVKQQTGFTLIELMATLAILGLLIAVAVPVMGSVMADAKKQSKEASITLIEKAGTLALLGNAPFDICGIYLVPTLVRKGYLGLEKEHDLYSYTNYVIQKPNKTFKFNGKPKEVFDFMRDPIQDRTAWKIIDYNGDNKNVVIPRTLCEKPVKTIGERAFSSNNLTDITIPQSVTMIKDYAIAFNDLTNLTLPDSVTIIGRHAFHGNDLKTVTFSTNTTIIGEYAFYGNDLTMIKIPDSVTKIGGYAFVSNNLESVIIPESVTTIEPEAFAANHELVIKGVAGSEAERFANSEGVTFQAIEID